MATSRTGTTRWLKVRAQALRLARLNGVTHCMFCRVELDYKQGRTPRSAEVDHLVPHSRGGEDVLENCAVICRRCNQSKGNRAAPSQVTVLAAKPLKVSRRWS
ncbi:hypothetical protein SCMU_27790 [Sinomonas cyclohexanicum]|uniref:HNH nuclease domain-containing protein n=1 Tax=Sinomonas cyclohexanicum TaxID=322009 RepID=A0ABN6FJ65_SINCY|nr:HNH endonuclease [Corynebacterium cyclohexanicum]BCT76937.1 hypothetical protein SCMU_27790 [Corynebacterium cyclohexanicum]